MAIEIHETFQVQAPIDAVWRLVIDPQAVVTCLPGAQLDEVVDERTFLGSVKVKIGAITATYKGRVHFIQVDDQQHVVELTAEGRETGGGTATGSMVSRLRSLPGGETEVVAEASVTLTGRLMQMSRGMIQGVAHQLFQQFVANVTQRLEAAPGAAPAPSPAPVRILPLLFRSLWAAVVRFFRRLFSSRSGPS